ncbi:MAG TPA: hypothetical protein PKW31_08050 [Synergistales bacterium]|mgnify:CR=1 FL=1|nr:hypothetical protein [Synergistales bacterium]
MNKKSVLPFLLIIVVSFTLFFWPGVLQAREYILLHGSSGRLAGSSTGNLVAGAGLLQGKEREGFSRSFRPQWVSYPLSCRT